MDNFALAKSELAQRIMAVDNQALFAHLRLVLDQLLSQQAQDFEMTDEDRSAISEGRADVAAGRVMSLDEFRKHFGRYEA
jgi:predicted transcriptional regulator